LTGKSKGQKVGYQRLTLENRYQIEAYKASGFSQSRIASKLGVNKSTISRELKRVEGSYSAKASQFEAKAQSSSRRFGKYSLSPADVKRVEQKLKDDWSPEQIVGRLKLKGKKSVSHQTIYRFIERNKVSDGDLWKHLRLLRKDRKQRRKSGFRWFKNPNLGRLHITERPDVVNQRKRLGDFERDTVFGSHNGKLLLTIVDRVSKLSFIEPVSKNSSQEIHQATLRALKKQKVHTITNDNGMEFAQHKKTAKALSTSIYFSRAYRSWERGTNENTNGLIRQYFPRKRSLDHVTRRQIKLIEKKLNSRPRKCLGFRTPLEVHRSP
jgi:transposase, IS30 family